MYERIYRLIVENINCIPCKQDKMEVVVCTSYNLKVAKEWNIKVDVSKASKPMKKNREDVF